MGSFPAPTLAGFAVLSHRRSWSASAAHPLARPWVEPSAEAVNARDCWSPSPTPDDPLLRQVAAWIAYRLDGLVIGKDRGAGYVSRIVNIDGKLFEFEVNADGTEVKTRPYTGETGVLTLRKIKGIKASVVTAIARQGKDVSFQIAGAKKGMVVPVGDYVLADAFLKGSSETARIRMGRMERLEVATDGETELQLGGPLTGEVPSPRLQDGKAVVSPNVQVFGTLGEEYYDFQPKGKVPTFELYDANTGKRLQKGKFPAG